jgi:hypothetical protein
VRAFAYAISAVFSLAIGAPLAALLVAGVTTPYGAAHAGYPSLGSLITGREGAFDPEQGTSCLTIEIEADGIGSLTILLPCRHGWAFEPGRAIVETIEPGQRALTYVLPEYVSGHPIRLEIAGSAKARSVGVGRLAH